MKKILQKSPKTAVRILAYLLLIGLCFILPASAISVTGAKYMGSIAPGQSDSQLITVSTGPDENPTDVEVDVLGFGQGMDQNYFPLSPADDISPYSGRMFITLSNSTLHLQPGVSQPVKATITLPQNVGSGGRYAIIYVHALPNSGVFITTGVIIPVLVTISGTQPMESGSILSVDTGTISVGQPITIKTTFKNTGNYHYYNTVNTVTIYDPNGNPAGNFSTQPSIYAIIPGNSVQYSATPRIPNLSAGTYTADSKVLLGDGTVLDEKKITFSLATNYVPPVTESNITLSPGSPATLTSPDGRYLVSFPQGAVLGDVVVSLGPYPANQLQPAPSGAKLGVTSFEITGLAGLLNKDATLNITYSADDLAAAGGDASQLKLSYWDETQRQWVILPTQVNTQDMTLTATTNHLGVWAVMISPSTNEGSPAATPTKAPIPVAFSIISFAAATVIFGAIVGRRK